MGARLGEPRSSLVCYHHGMWPNPGGLAAEGFMRDRLVPNGLNPFAGSKEG